MNEKELAAELQATKSTGMEWGEAETEAPETKRRLSAMVSIRLTKDELEQVQRRARERGQSVSAYIRDAAMRDLNAEVHAFHQPFASISTSGTYSAELHGTRTLFDGRRLATTSG